MNRNSHYYSDYESLWDAEDKYKRQKKKLTTFMKDWKSSTDAYLTFSAKEQAFRIPSSSNYLTDRNSNQQVKAINRYKYFDYDENENVDNSKWNGYLHSDRILRSASSNSCHLPRHISSLEKRVSTSRLSQTPTRTNFLPTATNYDADISERELHQRIASNRRQMISRTASPIYDPPTLPKNIEHQFGSAVCDELLNNDNLTNKTMSMIDRKDYREKKRSNYFIECQPNHWVPSAIQTQLPYRNLSNYLRRNIFAGDPTVYTRSTTQSDYSEDNYHVTCLPSKYRRKKYEQ